MSKLELAKSRRQFLQYLLTGTSFSLATKWLFPQPSNSFELVQSARCNPTSPDILGPFYQPNAPLRNRVGSGYVLTGVVKSVNNCRPLTGAKIELWLVGLDGEYSDRYRATIFSDKNGSYRFESHFPPPYSSRPPHIHLRVTAKNHQELITQHYPIERSKSAQFPLVLIPN